MTAQQHYYVYLLTNWDNTVMYIGVTNNLLCRFYEHKHKLVEGLNPGWVGLSMVWY
jgi:putative endonuclease